MLVEAGDRKILVDTGFGQGRAEKFRRIYDFRGSDNFMIEALAGEGLTPDQITDVIITHLHFDHAGGSTIDKDSDPKPTFPNARYYIQAAQLAHARKRMERDRASYFPADFEPLIERGCAEVVEGEWSLMPGIDVLVVNGHTPGMQLPRIANGGQTLLFAADLVPLASQFPLAWIMAYDLYPVTTLEEKRRILTQAEREGWQFFFEHDPLHAAGRVKWDGRDFQLE